MVICNIYNNIYIMQVLFADACKMTVALYGEPEMDDDWVPPDHLIRADGWMP